MGVSEPGTGIMFASKEVERQYLKERLAAGFRIFAKYGFDEGPGEELPRPRFMVISDSNHVRYSRSYIS